MNEHRLRQELAALQEEYAVRINPDQTVDLERVDFPAAWTPGRGTLRYAVPDDYPASPPTVHLPATMRYRGRQHIGRMQPSPYDGWTKWCVHFNGWSPRRHTLVTVTREMMGSLSDPSRQRLFQE